MRVIVAGAGLAGLTAAYALSRSGAEVEVVEADTRVGGRVWTYREPPLAPYHAELGGEFVESDHKALISLCRTFDLRLKRILIRGFGLAIRSGRGVRVWHDQTALWRKFKQILKPHVEAFEAADGDWSSTAAAALARRSLREVLQDGNASASVTRMAVALRNLYVADPDALSALMAVEEIRGGGNPSAIVTYRVEGGNDRVIRGLIEHGAFRVSRGCRLLAVAEHERKISATVEGASGRRSTLAADAIVVAVPVPLLREIAFTPGLPEAQRLAFDTVSMGPATKALLRFSSPWWRKHGYARAFGSDLPIGAVWDGGEDQRGAALLTLLAGGRASEQLHALVGDPRRLAHDLRWFNDGPREIPLVHSVSWDRQPWARGAYVYFSPKFDPALQPLLGRGFGRIFFAGSHTSRDYPGYMNGAVESGQRAASEITALLRK